MNNFFPHVVVGVPWIVRDDYSRLKGMLQADAGHYLLKVRAEDLPPTWDLWQAESEREIARIEARGYRTLRVTLKPDRFVAWCRKRGVLPTVTATRQFACEMAFEASLGIRTAKSIA